MTHYRNRQANTPVYTRTNTRITPHHARSRPLPQIFFPFSHFKDTNTRKCLTNNQAHQLKRAHCDRCAQYSGPFRDQHPVSLQAGNRKGVHQNPKAIGCTFPVGLQRACHLSESFTPTGTIRKCIGVLLSLAQQQPRYMDLNGVALYALL